MSLFIISACSSAPPPAEIDPALAERNRSSLTMEGGVIFPRFPDEGIDKKPFDGAEPVEFCQGPARSTIYMRKDIAEAVRADPEGFRALLPNLASTSRTLAVCSGPPDDEAPVEKLIDFLHDPLGRQS